MSRTEDIRNMQKWKKTELLKLLDDELFQNDSRWKYLTDALGTSIVIYIILF